jgi:DNA-binding LacI/PurR family transcriptional regulator
VLAAMANADPRVAFLAERQIPFACFGRTAPGMPQHWVDIDNRAAIREMTEHALARGHTRIAFFGYDPQGGWDLEREAGYREVMTAASLPVTLVRTTMAPADVDATVSDLLRPPDRPTAIITGSDLLAAACYAAASRAGRRIGADLAVTGFDGSVISRILFPALTTVAMPMAELASRLVDRIISEIDGASDDRGEVLATTLVWGESLSACP